MSTKREAKKSYTALAGDQVSADITKQIRSLEKEFRAGLGIRSKGVKKPTRLERTAKLHDRVVKLVNELEVEGFSTYLPILGLARSLCWDPR